ncbi:AsnC family transcriptional regulator [Candidatus Micrarchaeota archaeon]|nr:AsnC family transcriptional regulator [Candidatus Micrarchaeota archaeon]MBU1939570.1 AsnC family transcriptional regulator [Candidatus Micrarchaeota archaeon]
MSEKALDLLDRKIIYELDMDSRMSFKKLAKKARTSKETAAFRVKRLVKNGYIKNFVTTMHTSRLNSFYYKFFYKFHKTTPKIDNEIVAFIKNYVGVAYFASLEGRYDMTFLVLGKNFHDLQAFLVPFREKFGSYILEQEILTMTSVHRFNFRFFYEGGELLHTKYEEKLAEPGIDNTDYLIVKNLAENSRIPLTELAKITGKEINVVKYRIKRLKEKGIIGSHVLEIDFDKFGIQQIQVAFSLKDHSSIHKIINYVSHNPKATFATITLGRYDLALEFVVENSRQLRQILNSIKEKFSKEITDYDTFIMQEHGINWFPYRLDK